MFLRPINPYGFAAKVGAPTSYSTVEWLDFYKNALDYILRLNIKGHSVPRDIRRSYYAGYLLHLLRVSSTCNRQLELESVQSSSTTMVLYIRPTKLGC